MTNTKAIVSIGFFLGLSMVSGAQPAPEKLDFAATLERSLERSPEFRSLRLSESSAQLTEKNAWWAMAPSIDLSASHSYLQNSDKSLHTSTAYPWTTQAGIQLAENLYDNGTTWRNAESATLAARIEKLNLEKGRSRLLINVAKAFYDYSQATLSLNLRRQQMDALKVQFKSIESRYRQGLQSNRDYLRIQAQIKSSEISFLNQQLEVHSAVLQLRSLIGDFGVSEFIALDPSGEKNAPRLNVAGLNPQRSFEFRIAELRNQVADLKFENVWRSRLPTVSLKGSLDYIWPEYLGTGSSGTRRDPYWNLQATLILEHRLWDWGSRGRSVEIAENSKHIEYNNQDIIKLRVQKEIGDLSLQARLLEESFRANQQMLAANGSAYRSLNTGYLEGKVTYLELITSLNDLYSSRQHDLNLRFNILKLKADLAYYQGNVDEALKSR